MDAPTQRRRTYGPSRVQLWLPVLALAVLCACGLCQAKPPASRFSLRAVSSPAYAASDGDVLVELRVPGKSSWIVILNAVDATRDFRRVDGSEALFRALLKLRGGLNSVKVRSGGATVATLAILNHPLAGPIFSGPHQEPFVCQTEANGLGRALDSDCSAETKVDYYYKSTQSDSSPPAEASIGSLSSTPGALTRGFKPYLRSGPAPSDVANTFTSDGRPVPYIVRREIGTINRGVYAIQLLHKPGQPLPSPWERPTSGWNGRLVFEFGGGCGGGHHQGVLGSAGAPQEPVLEQGYAVATSTLNTSQNDCNDRLSAETMSMVKEHFIKEYGVPTHTIGWGGSGGAVQQLLIVQNYPGLLDGIIPYAAFPDIEIGLQWSVDCTLLDDALRRSKRGWSDPQKAAISGLATWRGCINVIGDLSGALDPRNCDAAVPVGVRYDSGRNRTGARCDVYDSRINVLGRDPGTGFARRPLDNEGVQYGLVAFNAGRISADQFIELNELIGGVDDDGNLVRGRMRSNTDALTVAYERGSVFTGGGGTRNTPIIDWGLYMDDLADVHDRFLAFVIRARMIAATGSASNQVIQGGPRPDWGQFYTQPNPQYGGAERTLVTNMDQWLDRIAADAAPGTPEERIARNRPEGLEDGCEATDGEKIVERASYGASNRCNQLYPPYGDPRIAAGAPLTSDILKCALKPVVPVDYAQPLSATQLAKLREIFPTGVCDYSRPGVGQEVTKVTWQTF